jgi:autotransporter-associated beta strand protein
MKLKATRINTARVSASLLAASFCGALSTPILAQDVWTGNDSAANSHPNWSDGANWQATTAPLPSDGLTFGGANVVNNNDFANGTAFDGISFSGTAPFNLTGNSILISGALAGNLIGVVNNPSSSAAAVALNLALDSGCYVFADFAGTGLGINGTLTPGIGSVAFFYNVTSTSLTTNATGLLAGLGGQGLIYSGTTPTALATVSGGSVQAYSAFTAQSPGNLPTSGGNNLQFQTTGTSGSYTLTANTSVNTITSQQTGTNLSTHTIATDTINLAGKVLTFGNQGGVYVLANDLGNKSCLNIANGGWITAGSSSSPASLVFAVNGNNANNQASISCGIEDNASGGHVSLITTGPGSINMATSTSNSYSGGTYVTQGQLQWGLPTQLGTGPVYVMTNASAYYIGTGTVSNNFFLASGAGASTAAVSAGGSLEFSGSGQQILLGTITLMGQPVSQGTPGCRISGNLSASQTAMFGGQITGTGTLDFYCNPHAENFVLSNTTASLNNWQGGMILEEVLAAPSSARNVIVKLGTNNQIPSGASAGNITLFSADSSTKNSIIRLDLNGFNATINGLIGSSAGFPVQVANFGPSNSTLTLGANNATALFNGTITDNGVTTKCLSLVKIGTGIETLSQTNTYFGSTTISNGTLALQGNGNLGNSPTINLAAPALLDGSGSSGVTVGSTQTLNGIGAINGPVTISGTVHPFFGTIGTLTQSNGTLTLSPAGTYVWNVNDATGTAGADPGWSLLNSTGTLQINATAGSPFTINVTSLAGDIAGSAAHFSTSQSYSWVIAQAAGGITGFTGSSQFNIVTSAFANDPNSSSQWSVTQNGNQLLLNFSGFQAITTPLVASETVNQGHNATFTVTANALGTGTTFAWYQSGNLLSNGGQSAGGAPGNVTIQTVGNTSTLTIAGADSAVEAADSGIIQVTVNTTYNGPQSASSSSTLTVIDTPYNPNVTSSQPATLTSAGGSTILDATASGTAPFNYQWYLNGTAINGANSSSYTVNVSPGATGSYTVVISNPAGSVTSSATVISGPVSVVPNQILFEPFNYPQQVHPSVPWTAVGVYDLYNQANGRAVAWQNVGNNDFTTLPIYNMSDQFAPSPRSLLGDEYPVEGLAGGAASCIYADSDVNGGEVNLPFGETNTTGTVYFSTVVQLWGFGNPAINDYLCGLGTGDTNSTTHSVGIYIQQNANQVPAYPNIPYQVGVFKGNLTPSQATPGTNGNWAPTSPLDYNILFLVCRVNLNAAGPGLSTCDLWVNPSPSAFYTNEANVPTPDVQGVGGTVADTPGGLSLFFMKITTYPVDRLFTDVRVGTTWASVTPPSGPRLSLPNQVLTNATSSKVVFASQNAGNPVSGNYQWAFNHGAGAVTLSDSTLGDGAVVSGSSTATLTITGATSAEVGTYTVSGSNTDPAASAAGATLTGSASAVLSAAPPALAISSSPPNILLAWPTNWAVALQATTSLTAPIAWSDVPAGASDFEEWPVGSGAISSVPSSMTVVGGDYMVSVAPGGTNNLYFRLAPSP